MVPQTFNRPFRSLFPIAACLAAAVLSMSACDKMPLTAPSGAVIAVLAGANAIPVGGSTTLTISLTEGGGATSGTGGAGGATTTTSGSGTPVENGTVIYVSTTLGTVQPSQVTTTNGIATVTLVAGAATGTATITAYSGGVTNSAKPTTVAVVGGLSITAPSASQVSTATTFSLTVATSGSSSGSTATNVGGNVVVDFGDSSTTSLGAVNTNTTVTHLYATAGLFTITATTTYSSGTSTSSTASLVVNPLSASVGFSSGSSAAHGTSAGLAVTLSNALATAGNTTTAVSPSIDHFEWDFGDGTTLSTSSASATHVFATAGTYTVTVKIVPLKGSAVSSSAQLQIT
jgi:hypothetical protein